MAIKRIVTRTCQCCGERKEIPEGGTYCSACSSPPAMSTTLLDTRNTESRYSPKTISKGVHHA